MLKMAIANVTEASLSHILHANLFKFIWQSVKPGHPTQTLTSTKGNKNTLMDDASCKYNCQFLPEISEADGNHETGVYVLGIGGQTLKAKNI